MFLLPLLLLAMKRGMWLVLLANLYFPTIQCVDWLLLLTVEIAEIVHVARCYSSIASSVLDAKIARSQICRNFISNEILFSCVLFFGPFVRPPARLIFCPT